MSGVMGVFPQPGKEEEGAVRLSFLDTFLREGIALLCATESGTRTPSPML